MIPFVSVPVGAASYNSTNALSYAAAHFNEDGNADNLCAKFVSQCLSAGGIGIYKVWVDDLYNALNGTHGKSYQLVLNANGTVSKSKNEAYLKDGDPIFYYCKKCNKWSHVVICNGYNKDGYATDFAKSNPHNGKRLTNTWLHQDGCGTTLALYSIRMNGSGNVVAPVVSNSKYSSDAIVKYANSIVGRRLEQRGLCLGYVMRWFNEVYGISANGTSCCAYHYGNRYRVSTSRQDIPKGAIVYFSGSDYWCGKDRCGHVGIHVGNNEIVHAYTQNGVPLVGKHKITAVESWGYPYQGWCWFGGVQLSDPNSVVKPSAPTLSLSTAKDIAAGDVVTITWGTIQYADSYTVELKNNDTNAFVESKTVKTSRCDFVINNKGSYSIYAYATNKAGNSSSSKLSSNIIVHEPCTVTFKDSDGKVLSVQSVKYGSAATAPVSPEKEGYLFNGWDKEFNKVTEDMTVTAKYRRKSFSVSFYDYAGKKIGDTQTVYWGEAATEPDVNLRPGYTFGGWDTAFDCIKANTKVTMVDYKWYNDNMLVSLNNATAVRDSDGNGYTVTVNVQNNGDEITSGRVIVALKTANGKLLTTTESAAFSLKTDAQKDFEIFIPYEYAATQVEIYAVEKFSTAIPISSKLAIEIDQGTAWTDWSTETPPENAAYVESRTEYRYADKKIMKSGISAMDGWTLSDTILVSKSYGSWQVSSPASSSYIDGNYCIKKTVENTPAYRTYGWYTSGKNYWWYQKNSGHTKLLQVYSSNTNPPTSGSDNGKAYVDTGKTLTVGSNASNIGTIYCINDNGSFVNSYTAGSSYIPIYKGEATKVYRQITQKYQYTLWQWGDWSDWSTTAVNSSDTRKVETRTVYRYRTNETTGIENDSGVKRTISGKLSPDYAGKEAILFIYRIESASDYTNEYVGQSVIGEDGSYSFTFKLREEPSINTGDFSVTLGIEGANVAVNLEKIVAPLPEYTVTFMGANQQVISTQTVKEGQNATVPSEIPVREGYYFKGWDTSTTNITNDTVVNAVYEAKTYSVVYLDWENQTVQLVEYTHGDEIENIAIGNTINKCAVGWDQILLGKTTVTENMVLIAQFDTKKYTVNFYDYDNRIISSQIIEYGETAVAPQITEKEHFVFLNWNTATYSCVTENLDVKPVYEFDSTVETPTANLTNKTYSSKQTLELSCATDGASIYYTTDGTDPLTSGVLYTTPISVDKTMRVRYIATKQFCNNSEEANGYYAINTEDMMSEWLTFSELPDEVVSSPGEYSLKSSVGYKYKDIVSTSSVKEMDELEANGWTLVETAWSDYSAWSEIYPDTTDLSTEFDTREADDIPVNVYKYSRWKFFDETAGVYKVTYKEKENTEGYWEYISSVDSLYISSFVDGKPAYSKDGEQWFNQTTSTEFVSAGYQLYRYKYEIRTYYRWSRWQTKAPTSTETREYVSDTVYQYLAPDNYIVSFDYSKSYDSEKNKEYFIVRDGYTIVLNDNYFDREGREFSALYKDSTLKNVWDINKDVVKKDITLYPVWVSETYKVRFLDHDGTLINEQNVEYLSYAQVPEDPKRDGYVFVGWGNYADGITSDCDFVAQYVSADEYTMVDLSRSKISMITGTTSQIAVSVTPDTSIDAELMWYSSNTDIVTVDSKGNLKAVHSGTAVITVVALDTFETDNCVVTVLGSADAEILPISGSAVTVDVSAKYLLGVKPGQNKIKQINEQLENIGLVYRDLYGNAYNDEEKLMGTGVKIMLYDDATIIDEVEIVVDGDTNGDGACDALDCAQVADASVGRSGLTGVYAAAADGNTDEIIDVMDYQSIVNKAVA